MKRLWHYRNENIDVVQTNISENQVDVLEVLHNLASREINEVLVEAGATLVGSFLDNNHADEMIIYMAPHLMGDSGRGLAKLPSITTMNDRLALEIEETRLIGSNIRIKANHYIISHLYVNNRSSQKDGKACIAADTLTTFGEIKQSSEF